MPCCGAKAPGAPGSSPVGDGEPARVEAVGTAPLLAHSRVIGLHWNR